MNNLYKNSKDVCFVISCFIINCFIFMSIAKAEVCFLPDDKGCSIVPVIQQECTGSKCNPTPTCGTNCFAKERDVINKRITDGFDSYYKSGNCYCLKNSCSGTYIEKTDSNQVCTGLCEDKNSVNYNKYKTCTDNDDDSCCPEGYFTKEPTNTQHCYDTYKSTSCDKTCYKVLNDPDCEANERLSFAAGVCSCVCKTGYERKNGSCVKIDDAKDFCVEFNYKCNGGTCPDDIINEIQMEAWMAYENIEQTSIVDYKKYCWNYDNLINNIRTYDLQSDGTYSGDSSIHHIGSGITKIRGDGWYILSINDIDMMKYTYSYFALEPYIYPVTTVDANNNPRFTNYVGKTVYDLGTGERLTKLLGAYEENIDKYLTVIDTDKTYTYTYDVNILLLEPEPGSEEPTNCETADEAPKCIYVNATCKNGSDIVCARDASVDHFVCNTITYKPTNERMLGSFGELADFCIDASYEGFTLHPNIYFIEDGSNTKYPFVPTGRRGDGDTFTFENCDIPGNSTGVLYVRARTGAEDKTVTIGGYNPTVTVGGYKIVDSKGEIKEIHKQKIGTRCYSEDININLHPYAVVNASLSNENIDGRPGKLYLQADTSQSLIFDINLATQFNFDAHLTSKPSSTSYSGGKHCHTTGEEFHYSDQEEIKIPTNEETIKKQIHEFQGTYGYWNYCLQSKTEVSNICINEISIGSKKVPTDVVVESGLAKDWIFSLGTYECCNEATYPYTEEPRINSAKYRDYQRCEEYLVGSVMHYRYRCNPDSVTLEDSDTGYYYCVDKCQEGYYPVLNLDSDYHDFYSNIVGYCVKTH